MLPAFDRQMPEPAGDGRSGRVSAGCVFWIEAVDQTFSTEAADHANCSVGSVTHGFKTLDDSGRKRGCRGECNWVTAEAVPQIPVVTERPGAVIYGPLAETRGDPDVVLLRITARQLMVLHDAVPNLRIEGKPQCHIIAIAKERGEIAASVGCQLSRVRTGMSNAELSSTFRCWRRPCRPSAFGLRRFFRGRRAGQREAVLVGHAARRATSHVGEVRVRHRRAFG